MSTQVHFSKHIYTSNEKSLSHVSIFGFQLIKKFILLIHLMAV